MLVSVALEARLLLRCTLGGGNRLEPPIGNLLATFDGASVGAFYKSLLGALNSGELSAQVIGLPLIEFLFVELRCGIRHLVLPSQLFPAGKAESSQRLLDPAALAAKKVSGSFELHLVSAVLQTACRQSAISSPGGRPRSLSQFPKGRQPTHFNTSRANHCLPRPALLGAKNVLGTDLRAQSLVRKGQILNLGREPV